MGLLISRSRRRFKFLDEVFKIKLTFFKDGGAFFRGKGTYFSRYRWYFLSSRCTFINCTFLIKLTFYDRRYLLKSDFFIFVDQDHIYFLIKKKIKTFTFKFHQAHFYHFRSWHTFSSKDQDRSFYHFRNLF